jgi:saccharopine dehydrogenase-like NADP-dependent oxidoreductase
MRRLTGIPAAIGAGMLARGEVEAKGVYAPEGCLEPEPFFAELARRQILIEQL